MLTYLVFTCLTTSFECLRHIYLSLQQGTTYPCMTSKSLSKSCSHILNMARTGTFQYIQSACDHESTYYRRLLHCSLKRFLEFEKCHEYCGHCQPIWFDSKQTPSCMIKNFLGGRGSYICKTPSPYKQFLPLPTPFNQFQEGFLNDPHPPTLSIFHCYLHPNHQP